MLTRREVLQQVGMMAALATTAPWWLVRRAHAARREKLIVWNPIAQAPQVERLMKEQCYAYAKQAGIKENELEYSSIGSCRLAAEAGGGAGGGEPAGCHPTREDHAQAPLYRSQGHLLEVTDVVEKMQHSAGGLFPVSLNAVMSHGQGLRRPPGREPLAACHPHGYPGGRQSRAPQDLGRVHRGLQEGAATAEAHRLRHVPGPARPMPITTS